jgi:hypothetical protein
LIITLQIDSVFEAMDTFFNSGKTSKAKYSKWDGVLQNGWDELEKERFVEFMWR